MLLEFYFLFFFFSLFDAQRNLYVWISMSPFIHCAFYLCLCLSRRTDWFLWAILFAFTLCRFVVSAWQNMLTMMSCGSFLAPIFSMWNVLINGWRSTRYAPSANLRLVEPMGRHPVPQALVSTKGRGWQVTRQLRVVVHTVLQCFKFLNPAGLQALNGYPPLFQSPLQSDVFEQALWSRQVGLEGFESCNIHKHLVAEIWKIPWFLSQIDENP